MSDFDATWLALREHADRRARAASLTRMLRRALRSSAARPLSVVDLGSGTGANLRYLAPRLGGRQRWRLIDRDSSLLAAFAPATRAAGLRVDATRRPMRCTDAARWRAAVELHCADLAGDWSIGRRTDLVCATALLDLVGAPVLDRILRRSRDARACVLFTLSYDGRIALSPRDPIDRDVIALVNQHQRGDKSMGAALGPSAAARAARHLLSLGFRVITRRSDWVLDAQHRALQRALVDGWAHAATEQRPRMASALAAWRERRQAHIAHHRAHVRVGHLDVLGLPR